MAKQLTFNFSLHEDSTFNNFFVGQNQALINTLKEVSHGRGEQFVYLWGNHGVGRTHLLQAACHEANRLKLSPIYLSFQKINALKPSILENLEALHLVCIDDIHGIAGRPAWEEAFFYFYNRMRDANKRLIVAGSVPPNQLGLALPDLISRLNWGMVFHIQELNDQEKMNALLWRAQNKGLNLKESVAHYLMTHWQRNLADLLSVLDQLDQASLREKRKLTIPFVKEILEL